MSDKFVAVFAFLTMFVGIQNVHGAGDPEDVALKLFTKLDSCLAPFRGTNSAANSFRGTRGQALRERIIVAYGLLSDWINAALQSNNVPLKAEIKNAFLEYKQNFYIEDPLKVYVQQWENVDDPPEGNTTRVKYPRDRSGGSSTGGRTM